MLKKNLMFSSKLKNTENPITKWDQCKFLSDWSSKLLITGKTIHLNRFCTMWDRLDCWNQLIDFALSLI